MERRRVVAHSCKAPLLREMTTMAVTGATIRAGMQYCGGPTSSELALVVNTRLNSNHGPEQEIPAVTCVRLITQMHRY